MCIIPGYCLEYQKLEFCQITSFDQSSISVSTLAEIYKRDYGAQTLKKCVWHIDYEISAI